jgi:hypothetical protein
VSETVWIRHPETEAVVEVPKAALPMYRQSNWDLLTKKELADLQQAQADEEAAAVARMEQLGRVALGQEPPPPAPAPSPPPHSDEPDSDAGGRQTSKKGNA